MQNVHNSGLNFNRWAETAKLKIANEQAKTCTKWFGEARMLNLTN